MRYRKLDANGDMVFGQQQANFYINQPEAVAQAVFTRLRLQLGEWFLDTRDGMDWKGSVLGVRTSFIRDAAIRSRVAGTQSLTSINNYSSGFDPNTRAFAAQFGVDTEFGRFGTVRFDFVLPTDAAALPRIPPQPINVNVTLEDATSADVTWTGT